MTRPSSIIPGVVVIEHDTLTEYRGTADALIAAKIITADQVPQTSSVTFYDGQRIGRGQRKRGQVPTDCRYVQVKRVGVARLYVLKGVGDASKRAQGSTKAGTVLEVAQTPATAIGESADWTDSRALRLPCLNIPAAIQHPKRWAELTTRARVLHAVAHARGLTVRHTDDEALSVPEDGDEPLARWIWIGSPAAFAASGLFKPSTNWNFLGWAFTNTAEGLRVDLLRVEGSETIIAAHRSLGAIGKRSSARFAAMAATDPGYQAFRNRFMAAVPGYTLEVEPEDEWSGPLSVDVPELVIKRAEWEKAFRELRKAIKDTGNRTQGLSAYAVAALQRFALMHARVERHEKRAELLAFASKLGKMLTASGKGGEHA